MKKRLWALLMCGILLLVCSCGNNGKRTDNVNVSSASDTVDVAIDIPVTDYISPADSFSGGNGSKETPFVISTGEELALMANLVNSNAVIDGQKTKYGEAYYVLSEDIELNDTSNYDNWGSECPKYNWNIIGDYINYSGAFSGSFDGQGHTISGLYLYADGVEHKAVGLFGQLEGRGVVANLILDKSYIFVPNGYDSTTAVGGIAGKLEMNSDASIVNCTNNSNITANVGNIGGILGYAGKGTAVKGCINNGTVAMKRISTDPRGCVGGVVGSFDGFRISDCENTGEVISQSIAGGVIGTVLVSAYFHSGVKNPDGTLFDPGYGENITGNKSFLENLKNSGQVGSNNQSVGGVIGSFTNMSSKSYVDGLVNEGNVVSYGDTGYAGGIFGELSCSAYGTDIGETVVSNCVNNADFDTCENQGYGGIAGSATAYESQILTIDSCINNGNLSSKGDVSVGGIADSALIFKGGTINFVGCINNGTISTGEAAAKGGIVSILQCSHYEEAPSIIKIENCINNGSIDGYSLAAVAGCGGIVGEMLTMLTAESSVTITGNINNGTLSYVVKEDGTTIACEGGVGGNLHFSGEGSFILSQNENKGDIIMIADGLSLDTLDKLAKRQKVGAMAGAISENAQCSGNISGGQLIIRGTDLVYDLGDFEFGMEYPSDEG